MGRKSRRAANNAPSLPNEIKGLVVEQLGIDGDKHTLLSLLNTSSAFAQVCRRELYRHVDFRGKSLGAVETFASAIAPRFNHYVLSISHAIPERDDLATLALYGDQHRPPKKHFRADGVTPNWRFFVQADTTFARALESLQNVVALNLTIPEDHVDHKGFPLWASTFDALSQWQGLRHLTLRSAGASQDLSMSEMQPASLDAAMEALAPHRHLHTLRLLHVRATPDDTWGFTSKRQEPPPPSLSELQALHLSGSFTSQHLYSVTRWGASNLTHLVLSEREWDGVEALQGLLRANKSTLESLVIRQRGELDWTATKGPTPASDEFPHLHRLALEIDTGVTSAIKFWSCLEGVGVVEIGAGAEETVADVVELLRPSSVWPKLVELSVTAHGDTEDWSELYELCEKKGVELIPGFDVEADFPCTRP